MIPKKTLILLSMFALGCADDQTASVDTRSAEYEFEILPDGAIVISELASMDEPSRLAYLVAFEGATPLELHLAVAPDEPVLPELEAHHREVTDLPPRDFSIPDTTEEAFRSYTGGVSSANCSLASDEDWFDDTWDAAGWTDHTYYSGTQPANWNERNTVSKTASVLMTHLCNYSESSGSVSLVHRVVHSGTVQAVRTGIDPGERGTIYVLGEGTHSWNGSALGPGGPGGQTNVIRLGIMAP